jgi:hypothetical protein
VLARIAQRQSCHGARLLRVKQRLELRQKEVVGEQRHG